MAEELYYEITPAEADAMAKFDVDAHPLIDPYCGKQNNGNFLISRSFVDTYSARPEIQAVDFTEKTAKPETQLDFKPPPKLKWLHQK